MCGRYVSPDRAAIERYWHIGRGSPNPFAARYNVAPQQGNAANYIPVVRQADTGELELASLQWWLLPFWSKEPRIKYSTFNARIETVAKAASFRDPLRRRRCIIPAMGWYEWQELPSGNLPWYLRGADGELLNLAGLWDRWEGQSEAIESCTIVVGPANEVFGKVHDRMPFVLSREAAERWMDRKLTDPGAAMDLLRQNPDDSISFHRVSSRVSNARNQGPELIQAVPEANSAIRTQ
jgi:putative SOS response-associated peptidase YedK